MLSIDTFQQNDSAFVASMSDGTVATMHYYKNEAPGPLQSELSWGVSCDENKVRLPQPACGMGLLDNGKSGNSIIACLRDGTVFVIPVIPMNDNDSNGSDGNYSDARLGDFTVFKLPQDSENSSSNLMGAGTVGSTDITTCFPQGFTAGYVRVRDWGNGDPELEKKDWKPGRLVPVFFHAWPGGLIDCHACGLTPDSLTTRRTSRTALKKRVFGENTRETKLSWTEILALTSSDVLVDLISFLMSIDLDKGHPADDKASTIHKAAMECKSLGKSEEDVLKRILSDGVDRMVSLESLSKLINELV